MNRDMKSAMFTFLISPKLSGSSQLGQHQKQCPALLLLPFFFFVPGCVCGKPSNTQEFNYTKK